MVSAGSQVVLDLKREPIETIMHNYRFSKAKKGEIIYFSSSELPRVFLLKKGNIKNVSVDEDGNLSSMLMEIIT